MSKVKITDEIREAAEKLLLAATAFAALASSTCAAAPSSEARVRCDLTDTRGDRSSWEFRIVDNSIFELSYTKNGVPPAHYVPAPWSSGGTVSDRVVFEAGNGWAMLVPTQPGGEAFLFHNSKTIAQGVCGLGAPPAPSSRPASRKGLFDDIPQVIPRSSKMQIKPPVNNDGLPPGFSREPASIQLEADGSHNLFVYAIIGGHSVRMGLDSGATRSVIQPDLADRLISEGEAVETEPETYRLANGEEQLMRVLIVTRMSVAGHPMSNQIVVVNQSYLLGVEQLHALNALVDFSSEALVFGQSP